MGTETNDDDLAQIKKAKVMFGCGIFLFVFGFAFLIWAAVMEDQGLPVSIMIPIGGFFGSAIVSIILMIKAYPGFAVSDIIKIDEKYDAQRLTELPTMEKNNVRQALLASKFQYTAEGYYTRKKFSFLKDYIYYHVRLTNDGNLENAIERETKRFDSLEKKGKNFCLIVFVYMDKLEKSDLEYVKEVGKGCIISETVLNPYSQVQLIMAAIDGTTNIGYFLNLEKKPISLYAHGCKLLKKIFG